MRIGVPKEIKNHEYRVALTPSGTRELVLRGHEVLIETQAGVGAGFLDTDYLAEGAQIMPNAEETFAKAEMIVKVKEPQSQEVLMLRDKLLFTYLHLAPEPALTKSLCEANTTAVAYETITDQNNRLPLLAPMSEVAGKLSIQAGATALQKANGGRGVLLGGVAGTSKAKVVVIGGGVAGENAARVSQGMGADTLIFDMNIDRLRQLDAMGFSTRFSTALAIEQALVEADMVVGSVLIRGAKAPKVVRREHLSIMKPGAVLVDISIDQGGCFETSHATTHADPTFVVDGIVHYCVANMPGAVAVTSTEALTNATLPFLLQLLDNVDGIKLSKNILSENTTGLRNGVNVYQGKVTDQAVAEGTGLEYTSLADLV